MSGPSWGCIATIGHNALCGCKRCPDAPLLWMHVSQTAIIKKSMKLQLGGWDTNDVPQPKDMMYNHSMFSTMSREAFDKEVLPKAHHCVFRDKEHLFRRGDSPTSFFIIIRGSTTS